MIATIAFSIMSILWKMAYRNNINLNGFDYVWVRSITLVIFSIFQAKYYKQNIFSVKKGYKLTIWKYGFSSAIGVPAFYVGLQYTPTSIASLIYSISPIIIAVVASLLLNEAITKMKVGMIIGSFIGAALFTLHKNSIPSEADNYLLGMILISFTWLTGTATAIFLRMMSQHVHFALCPVYFGFASVCISFALMIIAPSSFNFEYYTFYDWSLFVLSGVCNFIGQTSKAIAFKYGDASIVAPFCYFEVVVLFSFDILLFGYSFSITDLLGASLITVSIIIHLSEKIIKLMY